MKKTFDCLKMKEELQAKVYEKIKNMSASEEVEYFNSKARQNPWWNRLPEYVMSKRKTTDCGIATK